jgi:hypothetical protein
VLSSVRIVNCDAAITRAAGTQGWLPRSMNTSPPGIPDGAGGAFYAWSDWGDGWTVHVDAQRVDALGRPRWAPGGVAVTPLTAGAPPLTQQARAPAIVGDGAGGVILAFVQDTSYSPSAGHLRAQRVDGSGRILWGENGVSVCDASGAQLEPKIVSDGAGGAIVAWTDTRNGTTNADVYAQRLDAAGTALWQACGVPVASAASSQRKPVMVGDGSGGAIVAWRDDTLTSRAVFAQRVDGAGNALWTPGGIQLATSTDEPGIVTDGAGGAIIAWNDYRSSPSRSVADIYAARVDGAGTLAWTPGGAPVVEGVTVGSGAFEPGGASMHVTLAPDGEGGALVVWHDLRNGGWDVYAQRLDHAGARRWGASGAPVTTAPASQTAPAVLPDGAGGAICAWTDLRAGNADIFFQRLDAAGRRLLGSGGAWLEGKFEPDDLPKTSTDNLGGQYAPSLVPLADHRVLVTWDDSGHAATGPADLAGKVVEFVFASVEPGNAAVPPGGTVRFTASGGGGAGWAWSLSTNASGGRIDASTGEYVAGRVGGVTDVVQLADSWGVVATGEVTVTPGLSIEPGSTVAPPRSGLELVASGGSAEGYRWFFATNASGGSIDAGTGARGPEIGVYRAGATGDVSDVVQVEDSLGNVATATVALSAGLSVTSSSSAVAPKDSAWLEAAGGSGAGYEWSLLASASGGSVVACGDGAALYQAGPGGGVSDVVRVVDALGNEATVAIDVTAGISVTPSSATVAPLAALELGASGGSGTGYVWLFSVAASGGSLDPLTGAYRAGPRGDTVDVVEVFDSLGNRGSMSVDVTSGGSQQAGPTPDAPDGCGCRQGGSGSGSLVIAALLLLASRQRGARWTSPRTGP